MASISKHNAARTITCWWFGTFIFHFPYIGNNHPNTDFHIFQRGRYTTNQIMYFILPSKWPSKEYHGDAVYSMNMGPSEGCFQVEHRWHHYPTTTSPVQRFYDGISVLLPWSFSSTDWVATSSLEFNGNTSPRGCKAEDHGQTELSTSVLPTMNRNSSRSGKVDEDNSSLWGDTAS